MASTVEGNRLTRTHQAAQLAVAARAAQEARALWGRLDIDDLDGSTPYWLASSTISVNRRVAESQRLAAGYLQEYRLAEIGAAGAIVLKAPTETAGALRLAGPVRVKRLIAKGMPATEAFDAAFTKFSGIVRRQTLMGGRLTIAATAGRDRRAIGWRRVTDGNPCAFCAMLASRGPVYKDAASAAGLQYHGHCGCTAEPAYTLARSEDEEQFEDVYAEAAGMVHGAGKPANAKNILPVMRRIGGFRDSPRT